MCWSHSTERMTIRAEMNRRLRRTVLVMLCLSTWWSGTAYSHDSYPEALPEPIAIQEPGLIRCLFCGDRIALVFEDGKVELHEPPHGKTVGQFTLPATDWFFVAGASPDGSALYVLRSDDDSYEQGTVEAYRSSDGHKLWSIRGFEVQSCLAVSPDGKAIAVGGSSAIAPSAAWPVAADILVLDSETGAELARLRRKQSYGVNALAFSPSGDGLAAGYSEDGALVLWDWRGSQSSHTLFNTDLEYTKASITSIAYDGQGRLLATGDRNTCIPHQTPIVGEDIFASDTNFTIWDTQSRRLLFTKGLLSKWEAEVAVCHGGKGYLVLERQVQFGYDEARQQSTYASQKSRLTIWAPSTMVPTSPFNADTLFSSPEFSHDGKYLLVTSTTHSETDVPLGNSERPQLHFLIWSLPDWLTSEE